MPTEFSFSLGSLRLTPYRLVLIAAFIPSIMSLLNGRAGQINAADKLIFCHLLWSYIVIAEYHGMAVAIESGGIRMLEFGGAYLIARTSITTEKEFRGIVILILSIVSILLPLVIFEMITGYHLIKEISSLLMGYSFSGGIGSRFGLTRAYGPFDHPILFGVFAASLLGLAWVKGLPKLGRPRPINFPKKAVIVAALCSMSSGALAALMTQFTLLIWDKKTKAINYRWRLLTQLLLATYFVVDLISNRSGIKVFLSYLTFSAGTAYNRITIFEWGIQDVWRNPIFGIGFNDWTRPPWMHSSSMDNFWLVQAVTFGIPGFLTIALPVLILLFKNWKGLSARMSRVRTGWTISMVGIIVASCTVHMWNNLFVYFAFLVGMGGWFQNIKGVRGSKNGFK